MLFNNTTMHELISDYLNQNELLSQTEVIEVLQNPYGVSVVVLSGELGKVKRKFGIGVTFTELEV